LIDTTINHHFQLELPQKAENPPIYSGLRNEAFLSS